MVNPFTDYMGGIGSGVTPIVSGVFDIIIKVIAGLLFLTGVVIFAIWKKNKKNYNVPVTIWIPRSNNKILDEVSGVGGYFKEPNKDGGYTTVFKLKRKGIPTVEIPPPSSHFLVGLSKKLYLIQKGIDDFEPVDPTSFRSVTTQKGRNMAIIDLKCINQDATAWVEDNRESAKRRFTFHNFWEKYKDFIQITLFIFIVMISCYINWQGLEGVAKELARVAESLGGQVQVSGG